MRAGGASRIYAMLNVAHGPEAGMGGVASVLKLGLCCVCMSILIATSTYVASFFFGFLIYILLMLGS